MPRPPTLASSTRQDLWLSLQGVAIFALNVRMVGIGLVVMAVVFAGRKMPVSTAR
ncbi:MAG: hypothetical protein HY068_01005 [Burkholderiales bacterium]|nr:hypothetical protein [Burkholderiales bacterium]